MKLVLASLVLLFLAGCAEPAGEPVATQDIRIPGAWVFEPEVAQVHAGVPVTWTNDGGADHTVTIDAVGIDETIKPGESFTFTFEEPGTYAYTCILHPPDMAGKIIVIAAHNESAGPSHGHT